jgi:hypothetical protein
VSKSGTHGNRNRPVSQKVIINLFSISKTAPAAEIHLWQAKLAICLKVPKREIFDRSNFPDFYSIKSSWVGDLVVKILTYYFNF